MHFAQQFLIRFGMVKYTTEWGQIKNQIQRFVFGSLWNRTKVRVLFVPPLCEGVEYSFV